MVVLLNLEPRQKESVERMLEYSARRYAAGSTHEFDRKLANHERRQKTEDRR